MRLWYTIDVTGYSQKPLKDKLGIKLEFTVCILHAPFGYGKILGISDFHSELAEQSDFIQFFTKENKQLEDNFPILKSHLTSSGALWISWPKMSSGVKTDLNENSIREIGLRNGLVDVKVAAIDDVWSGLKFVFRLTDRS